MPVLSRVWVGAMSFCLMAMLPSAAGADEPIETVSIAPLLPDNGHRLYLPDMTLAHDTDSKVVVVDGDSFRYLGLLPLGLFGLFSISPDRKELYVATTYYSRQDHGTRTDTLEFYDAGTLRLTGEIVLPPKHAQSSAYAPYLTPAPVGSLLYIQNATPASSVTVIDRDKRTLLGEIPTAGCFGIYPSPTEAGRFSSLCADGSTVTINLDATGKEISRKRSAKLFDPTDDPVYIQPGYGDKILYFLSYIGTIHPIDVSGEVATQGPTWSILETAPAAVKGWRPGGSQVVTYNKLSHQLFMTMHDKGVEGSHKQSADEIWQIDVPTHKIVSRIAGEKAIAIEVSGDDHPLLFATSGDTGAIVKYDAVGKLHRLGATKPGLLEYPTNMRVE